MSTDSRSIKIAFAMSAIAKGGEFLNTLTMQYELRYKWWINAVVMILSVPHCLCWSFYFQNIITFLFEKLSCAVEILIWSDAVDFLIKWLGMPYSGVTAQQACSTEMVKLVIRFPEDVESPAAVYCDSTQDDRMWSAHTWITFIQDL